MNEALENSKLMKPYIQEYYNVLDYSRASETGRVPSKIYNALVDAIDQRHRLPRFILIIIDNDIIRDINVFSKHAVKYINDSVNWLTRNINNLIKRKRLALMDKKPGAIYGSDPTVIYVCMVRRIDVSFKKNSTLEKVFALRAKFNDALNEAVGRTNQRILTINSCNTNTHFDLRGGLSTKGKEAYWAEIDDLLDRFDRNKVKLLPNIKNRRPQSYEH